MDLRQPLLPQDLFPLLLPSNFFKNLLVSALICPTFAVPFTTLAGMVPVVI